MTSHTDNYLSSDVFLNSLLKTLCLHIVPLAIEINLGSSFSSTKFERDGNMFT